MVTCYLDKVKEGFSLKNYSKIVPDGLKDVLFDECRTLREVQSKVSAVFMKNGYQEVLTSGLEYFDVFNLPGATIPQREMYTTTDNNGKLIVMRPDSTLPIARMAASRLQNYERPIRLFYNQTVFRNLPDLSGRNDESAQMGIELLGAGDIHADIEVIKGAVEAIGTCTDNFRVEIGHVGFFKALAAKLPVTQAVRENIRATIEAKNYADLNDILKAVEPCEAVQAIKDLPRLFGGSEVFEKAEEYCTDYEITSVLDYLKSLYSALCELGLKEKIIVDLGLVQRNDYYTGVVFSAYLEQLGEAVAVGGRYDTLLEKFNLPMPAVGFALDADALAKIERNFSKNNLQAKKKSLRIALTKGRLEKSTVELFERIGLDCEELHNKGRKLVLSVNDGEFQVVLAKAADVITYVENGVCDMGIVGKDTIMENGSHFFEILDLGFGKCRFALAAPKDKDFFGGYSVKKIASKYPKVARKFFESKAMDIKIVKIEGSVELAPLLGLCDGIVDIVETGDTLRENGLEIIEEISDLSARLIVNLASLKLYKKEIEGLADKLQQEGEKQV